MANCEAKLVSIACTMLVLNCWRSCCTSASVRGGEAKLSIGWTGSGALRSEVQGGLSSDLAATVLLLACGTAHGTERFDEVLEKGFSAMQDSVTLSLPRSDGDMSCSRGVGIFVLRWHQEGCCDDKVHCRS